MESITAAGNTEIPAYLALLDRGLRVSRQQLADGREMWIAEDAMIRYSAPSALELLGIYSLRQQRGSDWQASDQQIHDYLTTYYPDAVS